MGVVGSLRGPSASTQKTPPQQMMFAETLYECDALSERKLTRFTKHQTKKYNAEDLYKACSSYNKKVE